MSLLCAILLGIIQGLTEFIPVSSSTHLHLAKDLLSISEPSILFDLSCHFGTLFALVLYFRHEIVELLRFKRQKLLLFFLALVPLVPAYLLLRPVREWAGREGVVGYFLMVTALLLFLGEKVRFSATRTRPVRDALLIGTMQAAALIPGISRSASTISCARALGWNAGDAARFSFLLSIPTILGGSGLELLKAVRSSAPFDLLPCLVGALFSFVIGFAVIRFAMRYLEKGRLIPFAVYCFILGVVLLI